jgi:hypothetical protein
MLKWEEQPATIAPVPQTLRYCKACGRETAHEIRSGAGVIARICVVCMNRSLHYELDRD